MLLAKHIRYTSQLLQLACLGMPSDSPPLLMQVFQAEATTTYGDTQHALQSTFASLDEGFRSDVRVAGQVCEQAMACRDYTPLSLWLVSR